MKIKNSINLTLSNPAANVRGSPIIGTQVNNNDHLPNLLNHLEDFFICLSLNGNHFFVVRFLEYKIFITFDPKTFPNANINNNKLL